GREGSLTYCPSCRTELRSRTRASSVPCRSRRSASSEPRSSARTCSLSVPAASAAAAKYLTVAMPASLPDGRAKGHAVPMAPRPWTGYRGRVTSTTAPSAGRRLAPARLTPGYFAGVMATGIVSIGAQLKGYPLLATLLFWVAVAFYLTLVVLT